MFLRHINSRVVKAEGNPHHPINQGGLCPRGQSCVQGLYDPDRLKSIIHGDEINITWISAIERISDTIKNANGKVQLVSNLQTGSLDEIFREFINTLGDRGKLIYWEPFNYETQRFAYRELFCIDGIPHLHLDESELIISFWADFPNYNSCSMGPESGEIIIAQYGRVWHIS